MTPLSWLTARLAAYLIIAAVVLSVVGNWQARTDGRLEERERAAVSHALHWHKSYVVARDSAHKLAVVAQRAAARSRALRDSVWVLNDSLLGVIVPDTGTPRVDTVPVPKIVIRRLVADSITIDRLTALTVVQGSALTMADSTIAAYASALKAAQTHRPGWFRRATAGIGHAAAGTACGATGWALGGPVIGLGAGALCAAVAGVLR
ncbi:MAG: hypothetical protein C0499_02340 [Zymomonas sp.]|nr:hypothetical protein [Zymomonas sp.]